MSKTKKMVLSALLLATTIVLSRFLSINTSILSIGFSFVPIVLAGIWLGPKYAGIISGLADLIGALLFPFGAFFIGYTISAIAKGVIYGLVLYKKGEDYTDKWLIVKLTIACTLVVVIVQFLMNSVWIYITTDKAFLPILTARVTAEAIMIPVQIVTMFILLKALKPITKKYLFEEE